MAPVELQPEPKLNSWSDDLAIVSLVAGGDRHARMQVADRLLDRIRRKVGYMAGRDRDAEDLVQMTMVEVLRSLDTFQGNSALETWADRIAVRTIMRVLKQRKIKFGAAAEEIDPSSVKDHREPSSSAALRIRQKLGALLEALAPKRRMALVLHHVEGYSVEEIAELTGTPAYTIRDRLKVGRKELREQVLGDTEMAILLNRGDNHDRP